MTTPAAPAGGPRSELSDDECRALLRTHTLGRVALVSGALPLIVPVEYIYDESSITFSAEHDAKLDAASPGDVLAFEVDMYDPESGEVASVHVLGRTSLFTAASNVGSTGYVQVQCEIVEGRRVRAPRR